MTDQYDPEKSLIPTLNKSARSGRVAFMVGLLLLLSAFLEAYSPHSIISAKASHSQAEGNAVSRGASSSAAAVSFRNTDPSVRYVGSKACAHCHEPEYQKFLQTPHGLAATLPTGRAELKNLPKDGVTVCQSDGERCFRVFPAKDGYSMSQFDRGSDGVETHIETERIAFALGKPLIATGYLIQRGNYLFEAPLTFYKEPVEGHVQGWGLSPGYDNDPLGFTRPVVDSCLTCHIGRPRPTDAASNRYQSPPFEELSIGCESCHGPGGLHIAERQTRRITVTMNGIDTSIVNPKHLTSQLADETCMYCHELGEARIPLPGKSFQDYRPGAPLLRTQAVFKSKLLLGWNLEEWSDEIATSACSRFSKGALRCSTCHDPHFTPRAQEAPTFYRAKCLTCHQTSSCTLPIAERQHTQPVDNCITCHMPKHDAPKLVKIGGRGTSHRITKTEDEPLPTMDTPQTAPDPETGLILVNSDIVGAQESLPPLTLLSGFQSVLAHEPTRVDLTERYKLLLHSLAGDQNEVVVFEALAEEDLAKKTAEGTRQALHDLNQAVTLDSKAPKDYMMLSELQYRAGNLDAAIRVLSIAVEKFPYIPTPYENLAVCYLRTGDAGKASDTVRRGLQIFPSDRNLLRLAEKALRP